MLFADDDRHAVVRLNHGSVGNACEDCKAVLAVNNLIDSAEIDQLFSANGEDSTFIGDGSNYLDVYQF